MKPISIYGNLETNFAGNGLAVLEFAKDVVIKQEINGSYELSFTLPPCDKWEHVKEENIVKCGKELFRIVKIVGHTVTARSIYYDAVYKHIQYLGDMIGMQPRGIMVSVFAGTNIHVMTYSEVEALGMEWVTEPTDFFEVSKINPIGCMETLVKTLNSQKINAELYIDNYNIALVKSMGKWRGTRIDAKLNCRKNPEWQRDTQNIVTRLYPYGKDDLHIDSVTAGSRQYIDSPNIAKFGVKEGYAEFSEIEEPDELLQAALWQFDENNMERVDVPKYAFDIDWVDISKLPGYAGKHQVKLGDIVEVHDRDFDVISKQRVIVIEQHPFEPNKNKLTVGNPPQNLSQIMDNLIDGNAQYNKTTNGKGEVKTGWLEHMQCNETISINNDLSKQDIALYKTGALWESPDGTAAVAIINGRVALSNQKRGGQWYWTTISDAGKIIVNEVFTGTLYTEFVKLMGEGAQLEIYNNMITFRAQDGKIMSRWGFTNAGKYVFEIYNGNGEKAIYLDSDGKIIAATEIRGGSITSDTIIDVKTDATIGNKLILKHDNVVGGTISIYDGPDTAPTLNIRAEGARPVMISTGIGTTQIQFNPSTTYVRGKNELRLGTTDGNDRVYINNKLAATEDDIANLQGQINALQRQES